MYVEEMGQVATPETVDVHVNFFHIFYFYIKYIIYINFNIDDDGSTI